MDVNLKKKEHARDRSNEETKNRSDNSDYAIPGYMDIHPALLIGFLESLSIISFYIDIINGKFKIAAASSIIDQYHSSDETIVGKFANELNFENIISMSLPRFDECAKEGTFVEFELFVPEHNIYLNSHLYPVLNNGEVQHIVGVMRDISESKKMDAAFQEKEKRHNFLISRLPDIVFVHVDGQIMFINDSVHTMLGYQPQQVIGRSLYDFLPSSEHTRIHDIHIRRNVNEDVPDMYETTVTHIDGRAIEVEARVLPIDYEGQKGRLIVLTDISERKKIAAIEERFREMADLLPETIYETDLKGYFTYVNKAGINTYGYTDDEIKHGIKLSEVFTPDQMQKITDNNLRSFKDRTIRCNELLITKKDGIQVPIVVKTVAVFREGKPVGTRGVVFDDTERKNYESSLLLNQQRLETLLHVSQMNSFSVEDIVKYVIEKVAALTKSKVWYVAVLNKNWNMPTFYERLLPDSQKTETMVQRLSSEDIELWKSFFDSHDPIVMNHFDLKTISPGSKSFRPVKRQIIAPIFEGDLISAVVSVGDKNEPYDDTDIMQFTLLMNEFSRIVQHRYQEEIIAEEREKLAVTIRSIGDGVIAVDKYCRITLMNQAAEKITGRYLSDAMGTDIDNFLIIESEKTGTRIQSILRAAVLNGREQSIGYDSVLVHKTGTRIPIEATASPLLDRDNKTTGAVVVFSDISEKRQIEESRMRTMKLESVGLMAGGIAHDFNNILASIVGNISLVRHTLSDNEESRDRLIMAEKAAMRARALTQQLLTISKGGIPVKSSSSIADIIKECADLILRGSDIECELDIQTNFPFVEVDEAQIIQVINNLIINAVQAMPLNGKIKIQGRTAEISESNVYLLDPGHYVKISITDNGKGIPSDNIGKIFDPYFTTKKTGHGLGLATAFSIIAKHSGYIGVESRPGMTQFYFYLPAIKLPSEQAAKKKSSGKILILDDETAIGIVLTKFCECYGYESAITTDGKDTVKMYLEAIKNQDPFDAVLLDLVIPNGTGGKETISELLKIDPKVKAIVCSGYSDDSVMANFKYYGFIGRIAKPYMMDDLNKLLKQIIARKI